MDYTDLTKVKDAISAQSTNKDTLIGRLITAASRAWDLKCTGTPDGYDYFKLETKTNEVLEGIINRDDEVICYPHKPIITSITAMSFRQRIIDTAITIDPTRIDFNGNRVVGYPTSNPFGQNRCKITITYSGGYGAALADLPADMVDAVTILVVRFFREYEGNLNDAIGVAELGRMVYTKSWPTRIEDMARFYSRKQGWKFIG